MNFKKILIIFFSIFGFFGFVFAGDGDNVSGWAWSENVGWISFNCKDLETCSTSSYGVNISTSTGYFSGYAWSENIGWISFNRADTGAPPSNDPCPDGSCIAKVENVRQIGQSNVKVLGWARVLANGGGWDGWIRFDHGKEGEVYIDKNGEFHGWAWSDMVVGWISFNSADPGAGGASYKVVLDVSSFNQPPTASNLQQNIQYCNVYAGQGKINLSWTYTDPEKTNQAAYSLEVQQSADGGKSWQTKVLCENIPTSAPPSGGRGTSAVYIKSNPTSDLCDLPSFVGDVEYGKLTRWRVKVKDGDGNWSEWTEWTSSFSIDPHAYPWVDFSWKPERPTVNEVVQFTDLSECYVARCNDWFWTFQDGKPSNSTNTNATTTFTFPGSKTVTLKVKDSDGYECTGSKTVQISFPLPKWKEIPPFIWLRKILASLVEAFDGIFK